MERKKIIATVNDFLVNEFEVDSDEISNEANFKKTLGLDSLDYIDLVVVIESNFGVKLGEADFKNIVTFDDFYSKIEHKIAEKNA
ncbi:MULTISPECIES: acyl carrier protein [Chryseobacterium]|uniref:Acyl carrier protein n=1 Tax=Chryseobacterium camelliae TaxID=1265445 RepID=A0ABU0TLK8_9FLAO|nr:MULTISPECIES: phosphopantetheine-binding protein [Chryseobacterium]MDT3408211.1 acyl carrier protein [Pseudacidovorax intermedius]MDQ1097935.1 acyl carrier protein [Chryseobacterium camelliae]MDQ1101866.1 acyl carrier protein [Chryseobacterium sp. SORGH_AS_1048]MDR6085306.1 acyl carrier protein [Chryseobacterium sp. SORGH_AS_0909]MDR6129663.1 acyl carrier protein [Chryseobacterium sp. SORGH_AS_1175]